MSRGYLILSWLVALQLLPIAAVADSVDVGFITTFNSRIALERDGSVNVQEEVLYNFNGQERHGIYRELPIDFQGPDGSERSVAITNLSVTDKDGKIVPIEVGGGGNFVSIKIGDPERVVSGEVLYVIRYRLLGAVQPRERGKGGIFTWQALGSGWNDPILKARVEIVPPEILASTDISATCTRMLNSVLRPCGEQHQIGTATGTMAMLRFLSDEVLQGERLLVQAEIRDGSISVARRVKEGKEQPKLPAFAWNDYVSYISFLVSLFYLQTRRLIRKDVALSLMGMGLFATLLESPWRTGVVILLIVIALLPLLRGLGRKTQ